jgi:hypothetical protein
MRDKGRVKGDGKKEKWEGQKPAKGEKKDRKSKDVLKKIGRLMG